MIDKISKHYATQTLTVDKSCKLRVAYPLSTSQCNIPAVIPFVTEKTGNKLSG